MLFYNNLSLPAAGRLYEDTSQLRGSWIIVEIKISPPFLTTS